MLAQWYTAHMKSVQKGFLILMQIGAVACVLGIIFGQLGNVWWAFELFSHFILQYAVFSFIAMLFFVFTPRKGFALIPALAFFISAVMIAPIYFQTPNKLGAATLGQQEQGGRIIQQIGFFNVGTDRSSTQSLVNTIEAIDAQVLCLAEVDATLMSSLEQELPRYVYTEYAQGPGVFDLAVLSASPISIDVHTLGDSNLPALVVDTADGVVMICAHPTPPTNMDYAQQRDEYMQGVAQLASAQNAPTVLVGDFNMTSWSPAFAAVATTAKMEDSRQGIGLHTTWPSRLPAFLRIPIDHALVNEQVEVMDRSILKSTTSDHMGISLTVRHAQTEE